MIAQKTQESIISVFDTLSDEELESLGKNEPKLHEIVEDILAEREADCVEAGHIETVNKNELLRSVRESVA